MTKKKKTRRRNLRGQLKQRMKELDKIGESKFEAKKELKNSPDYQFGDTVEGIYSISTMKNYNQIGYEFIEFARSQGAGNRENLNDVILKYGDKYLEYREKQGLSVATLKRDRAGLNKIAKGHRFERSFEKMTVNEIKRSRNQKNSENIHFNEQLNADLVALAKGTGGRREDLRKLTPESFFERKGRLYVRFNDSKGGRDRVSYVRNEHREQIEKKIRETPANMPLFDKIHKHADIHSYRREYAQNLYADILKDDDLKRDLTDLYGKRYEPGVKTDLYKTHGEDNRFVGYRDDIHIITKALGHNRLNVAVNHYLR